MFFDLGVHSEADGGLVALIGLAAPRWAIAAEQIGPCHPPRLVVLHGLWVHLVELAQRTRNVARLTRGNGTGHPGAFGGKVCVDLLVQVGNALPGCLIAGTYP